MCSWISLIPGEAGNFDTNELEPKDSDKNWYVNYERLACFSNGINLAWNKLDEEEMFVFMPLQNYLLWIIDKMLV